MEWGEVGKGGGGRVGGVGRGGRVGVVVEGWWVV